MHSCMYPPPPPPVAPTAAAFKLLAEKFDFSRYKTLADIGGSAGVLCCAVAHAHSHVSCTTLDLPAVHAAAGQYIAGQGLQDRVKVCAEK
jgi:cyclopropane fatty-acyl-phospholipid synthase-like methyltransferase